MAGYPVDTFTIRTYRAFEPTEISGLVGWWDASTLSGADGSSVSAWLDSSGNEAHMYQSTSAAQPTLQTNELNGQNVVRFDGVDDFMNLTAPFDAQPTSVSTYNANAFSPNGEYLAHANANTLPRLIIYKKTGNVLNKLPDPATLPTGNVNGLAWSADNQFLAVAHTTTPFITIYQRSGDTFTKLGNPVNLPAGTGADCAFSKDGSFLAVTHATTPFITIYSISGTLFTKLANPASLPTATGAGVSFSPDNNYLTVGFGASPFVHTYSISGTIFTKLTNPTTLPTANVNSVSWISSSDKFALSQETGDVLIFDLVTGLFQNTASFVPVGVTRSLRFSADDNYLAVAHANSPFFTVYSRVSNTFTPLATPASIPISTGRGVSWGLDDGFLAVSHTTAPFIQMYNFDGTTLTNLNRLNLLRNVAGATLICVHKMSAPPDQTVLFNVASGTIAGYRAAIFTSSASNVYLLANRILDANIATTINSVQTQTTNWTVFNGHLNFNTKNRRIFFDGYIDAENNTMAGTAGNTSDTDSLSIFIGKYTSSGYDFNGDIAEVMLFNRVLTDQERINLHEYISRKWGITLA